MIDQPNPDPKSGRNWLQRNLGNIVVLASILVLAFMQLPMIKGIVYRATGSIPQDRIAWRTDYAAALEEARESGKPILVGFQRLVVSALPDDEA